MATNTRTYESEYAYFVRRYGNTKLGRWLARHDAKRCMR